MRPNEQGLQRKELKSLLSSKTASFEKPPTPKYIVIVQQLRHFLFCASQWLTRQQKYMFFCVLDVCLAPICFYVACAFTYAMLWPSEQLARLALVFLTVAVLGGFASVTLGLTRVKLKSYQSIIALGILPYAMLVGAGAFFVTGAQGLYFPVVGNIVFTLLLFLFSVGSRALMLWLYLWALRSNSRPVRVLIYGAGETGLQLASALRAHNSIRLIGFLDDDAQMYGMRYAGVRVFEPAKIEEIVRNHGITRIILAITDISAPKLVKLGRKLQALGLEVQVLPSFGQLAGPEVLVDTLSSLQAHNFLGRDGLDTCISHREDSYRGRVVMVSGAGGSVGSELCRQLLTCAPRKIVLFEISEIALYTVERELRELCGELPIQLTPILGSITDARAVYQALEGQCVEVVLHAAAYKHVPLVEHNPITGLLNNAVGTRTLAEACVKAGVQRFLLVSTDKAVRPTNVMGASKRMAEMVVQDISKHNPNIQFSIVRFGNVLGSSGSVIPLFKEQIAHGGPVTLTHESVTRYFMTISEAARLVLLAGSFCDESRKQHADVFVLDMGKPVLIRDLAAQLIQAAGYTVRDERNPNGDIEIKVIGLRPGEKLHEELLIGGDMHPTPHPKILRAAEVSEAAESITEFLHELVQIAARGDMQAARSLALEVAAGRIHRPALKTAANVI